METKNELDISQALKAGLSLLTDRQVRVPALDIDDLAALKGILIRLVRGELLIVTPDVVEAAKRAGNPTETPEKE